ncbi:TonB-dependent receptor [candidate division KSB1 bacterium]|nr:TonB-dependent receptor [candidate division KSB1 bacterium]
MKRTRVEIVLAFALILTLLSASAVNAQSDIKLYGTVFDGATGNPLFGANVVLEGTGFGDATDQRGYFAVENLLEGIYTVCASHVGYEKQFIADVRIPKDRPVKLTFILQPNPILLRSVEISAERYIQQVNGDMWVIPNESIVRSGSHNIGEMINQVPGVAVQDAGGISGSKKISIRGSQSNQVLVLLDGVPLNDESMGDVDLTNIPTNLVERIEIHKGGQSHRFGSGALAGVINIITKKTLQNDIQLNSGFGSFQMMTIAPAFSGQYKQLGYMFASQYLSSEGNFPYQYVDSKGETISENRANADMLSRNFFGRLTYSHNAHSISIQGQQMRSHRGIPGKIDAWTPFARIDYEQKLMGIEYRFLTSAVEFSLNTHFSDAETENRNLYPADVERRYKRYPQYHYRYDLQNVIINSDVQVTPSRSVQFTLGHTYRHLNYQNENLMPSLTPPIQQAQDDAHGLFVHQDWRIGLPWLGMQLSITPTVRYDEMRIQSGEQQRFEQQWSPACGFWISFGKTQKLYLKSSVSRSFRVPTFTDLFYQDMRIEGKADLLPEKSDNVELGVGWEFNKWGVWQAEVTHFHYTIDDLIVWRLGSFEVFRPFNNDAEITGQEVLLTTRTPNQLFNMELSYQYLTPLNKNPNQTTYDKIIPYRPQTSLKGSCGVQLGDWALSTSYRNVGERYINEANTKALPAYSVWDVNLNWTRRVAAIELAMKLSCFNAGDERYTIVRDMPLPGREWRAGLNIAY